MKKSAITMTLLMAMSFSSSANAEHTYFVEMLNPKDKTQSITSDIDTLLKNGLLTQQVHDRVQELGDTFMANVQLSFDEANKRGMTIEGKPIAEFTAGFNDIDLSLDMIPKIDGYGPMVSKPMQVSSVQFYNRPDVKRIIIPIWQDKMRTLESDILVNLNRGMIWQGMMIHESISVLGGHDNDYMESINLLWNTLIEKQTLVPKINTPVLGVHFSLGNNSRSAIISNENRTFVSKFDRSLFSKKGGASIVGGGGSDVSFTTKLLMDTIARHLISETAFKTSDIPDINEMENELLASYAALNAEQKSEFISRLLGAIVDEGSCSEAGIYQIIQERDIGRVTVRFCSPKFLNQQINLSSKFMDKIALSVAQNLLKVKP